MDHINKSYMPNEHSSKENAFIICFCKAAFFIKTFMMEDTCINSKTKL